MTAAARAAKVRQPAKARKAAPGRVRDRIFETACDLFDRNGIRDVCVDAIASEAGSNKMSFYRNFSSKENLVTEYLRGQEQEYWAWWDAAIAPYSGDARRQLEALFAAYVEKSRSCSISGCALGNAALELRDENHPGFAIVRGYKVEMRNRLRSLAREAGARDPDQLGDALQLIMEGGYLTRITFSGNDGPYVAIAAAARMLVDSHIPLRAHRPS
jgi:AcrR family transcriptional regulator